MRFFISSDPEALRAKLTEFACTATVEAEYGDDLVSGNVTLAHHGSRASNPCPCLSEWTEDYGRIEAVGLSHLDLDSLGGCMALLDAKTATPEFWELAAFVDTNGPHRIKKGNWHQQDLDRLNAWWAWSKDNRVQAPRDGAVMDITEEVCIASAQLNYILGGYEPLLAAGRQFAQDEAALNTNSFIELDGNEVEGLVIVRVSPAFTSHLYQTPDGVEADCVVAFRTDTGSITVSTQNPGIDCCHIVQLLWGRDAGGHQGIAGSPRGWRMSLSDLVHAREGVICAFQALRDSR